MTFIRPGFMVVIVGATLTSISTVIVGLRYYCRHFLIVGSTTASDHLMLTALILTWGNFIVNYYQDDTSSKFRPSYIKIPERRPEIEKTVRGTLITWWLYRMTYIAALCFVKLSILYFYRVIATQRTFRRIVHVTIAFVSLYSLAAILAAMFQCANPSDAWSTANFFAQFDSKRDGKRRKPACFDPSRLWIFCGAANLLSDVVILLMPIPALVSLRIPVSKRLALIGIFSLGIMAIIASSVRMWVVLLWAKSPSNGARFGVDLLLWGQVETNAGIMSASVPFLRLLFTGKERQNRTATPAGVMDMGPPQPMGADHVGLPRTAHLEMWDLGFDEEGEVDEDEDEPGDKRRAWKPFITVPESFSTRSGSSAHGEPSRSHDAL